MRVLMATYPEKTIFQAMVPLAWALRAAGHEVLVASQPFFAGTITGAGLPAAGVGRQTTDGWRRLTEAYPDLAAATRVGLPPPYDAAAAGAEPDRDAMVAGYRHMIEIWHRQNNGPLVAGLVELARQWRPDLVVWETTTYAGAIAAAACGAAHARLLWSLDVFGVTREVFRRLPGARGPDPLAEWLAGYGRVHGFAFTEELVTGQFTVDQLPGPLRRDADLHYVPMRYVPYGGPAAVPGWLTRPPRRPRVALTLGTSTTEWFGEYTFSVRDAIHALAELDVEVVATIADSERAALGAVPDAARIVPFVPLDALAPTCAAVVNHAGPGTLLTTARHGVPQVGVPWEFDEPELAGLLAGHGAGLTVPGARVTGPAVRDAVARLLAEPSFADRAADLRDRMHAMPTAAASVPLVEELAHAHRTRAAS